MLELRSVAHFAAGPEGPPAPEDAAGANGPGEPVDPWVSSGPGEPVLRPHMRAALGSLGAEHGRRAARGETFHDYRATGCDCDYCTAFERAFVDATGV